MPAAAAEELPEYRLKAAFLYNFALFTDWPAEVEATLTLCVHGTDPFGAELEALEGKRVGARTLVVRRRSSLQQLRSCQIVFVAAPVAGELPRVLDAVRGPPVLVVADSAGAASQGATLALGMSEGRVTFAANLQAARAVRLNLSSRLLKLATEVLQ